MKLPDGEDALVSALEDFHRRIALGEKATAEEYREHLGDRYAEFAEKLWQAEAIDREEAVRERPSAVSSLPRAFGPYYLERVLRGGAMGIVYVAFHRRLARRVALKVLPSTLEPDERSVERFRREARQCAQVRHPNVVTVHESGEIDGQIYYTMELVEGKTLQDHIER